MAFFTTVLTHAQLATSPFENLEVALFCTEGAATNQLRASPWENGPSPDQAL
jgi:hypothetical protein